MAELHQEIRYCISADGTRLAYATMGKGSPLVKPPNWFGVEYELESLVWRHWVEELAQTHQLIRYDQRGCGLSDGGEGEISLEAWVQDLDAVVEAAGLQRFPLIGVSQGGPVAVEYAVRHPDRVTHLVLCGAMALGPAKSSVPDEVARHDALITLAREGWDQERSTFRDLFASIALPDATAERRQALSDLCRKSTSGSVAARILTAIGNVDVVDKLPQVTVPTLVLHAVDDQLTSYDQARTFAALIPKARLVPLDSSNHALQSDEPAWQVFVAEMRGFLSEPPAASRMDLRETESGKSILSQRELDVLRLLAQGKSNPEIAKALFITRNTVQNHVGSILIKTNLGNRTEAAVYAKEHGLV